MPVSHTPRLKALVALGSPRNETKRNEIRVDEARQDLSRVCEAPGMTFSGTMCWRRALSRHGGTAEDSLLILCLKWAGPGDGI